MCLSPLSTIFQIYCGRQFLCGGNHLPVTDNLYHLMLHIVHFTNERDLNSQL